MAHLPSFIIPNILIMFLKKLLCHWLALIIEWKENMLRHQFICPLPLISTYLYQFSNNNPVSVLYQICIYMNMLHSVAGNLSLGSVNYRKTRFVWYSLLFTKPSCFSTQYLCSSRLLQIDCLGCVLVTLKIPKLRLLVFEYCKKEPRQ